MMRILLGFAALLLILPLVFSEIGFAQKPPRFWLSNLEGKRFDSRKHKGPYVVSFFFVNCPPCIKEMPQLQALMEVEMPGVPLLFIDPLKDDTIESIKDFVGRINVSLEFVYQDAFGRVAKKFNNNKVMREFPTLIGVNGKTIVFRLVGEQKFDDIFKSKLLGLKHKKSQ